MGGLGNIVQKALYLGIGIAAYAGEKAGGKLGELRTQVQKLADEMVARGEMTTEEAKRLVEEMMKQAQQPAATEPVDSTTPKEPRRIEILSDEEEGSPEQEEQDIEPLRQQVIELQEELRKLKRNQ